MSVIEYVFTLCLNSTCVCLLKEKAGLKGTLWTLLFTFLAKRGVENELTGHFVMLTDVGTHLILRISCFGSFNRFWIFAVCRLRLLLVFWFVCLALFLFFVFLVSLSYLCTFGNFLPILAGTWFQQPEKKAEKSFSTSTEHTRCQNGKVCLYSVKSITQFHLLFLDSRREKN